MKLKMTESVVTDCEQVTVLSPKEGTISYAGQTSADSVLMNPTQPIIALKGREPAEWLVTCLFSSRIYLLTKLLFFNVESVPKVCGNL